MKIKILEFQKSERVINYNDSKFDDDVLDTPAELLVQVIDDNPKPHWRFVHSNDLSTAINEAVDRIVFNEFYEHEELTFKELGLVPLCYNTPEGDSGVINKVGDYLYNKSLFSKNEIEKIDEKLIKKGYEIFKPHILNEIKE